MAEVREVSLLALDDVIEEIMQETRQQIDRLHHEVVNDCEAYFEAVRQRMPALTGNAASAVTFAVSESKNRVEIVVAQEDFGVSGDPLARYMPGGILTREPHTAGHSVWEQETAMKKVGHVVVNPNARRDPWKDAADELGWTDFQREGMNPTIITATPPSLRRAMEFA